MRNKITRERTIRTNTERERERERKREREREREREEALGLISIVYRMFDTRHQTYNVYLNSLFYILMCNINS